jgi:hypothetical protein
MQNEVINKADDAAARNFTFGIEIECYVPRSCRIQTSGWSCHGERRFPAVTGGYAVDGEYIEAPVTADGRGFQATTDGSLTQAPSGFYGVEFVSHVLSGDEGVDIVCRFMQFLSKIGARVNRTCGLHIHVGIRSAIGNASVERTCEFISDVCATANRHQWALYGQTGTNRHQHYYCSPMSDAKKQTIKNAKDLHTMARTNRVDIINLQNVTGTGTIEFRCFAGTTNVNKVVHHLASVFAIVSLAANEGDKAWREPRETTAWKALRNSWGHFGWVNRKKALIAKRTENGTDIAWGLFGELKTRIHAGRKEAIRLARKFDERFPLA